MSSHAGASDPDPRGICGENVTYAENGTPIYTDPKTHGRYTWNSKNHAWMPNNPDDNESSATYDIDEDGHRIFTDNDGTVYFWDTERNAWFPKIDDDFMARYQMNYGFIDNTSAAEEEKRQKQQHEAQLKDLELKRMTEEANVSAASTSTTMGNKRKAVAEPAKWFDMDPAHNTKVYVSNLPLDITLDEFAELMGKCGMIMRDQKTQKFKLKLYAEPDGQLKGDGLCDYIKVESVDLALNILDEYDVRGHKIRVQRAKFEMRGEYNPALKPKRKKKDKEKLAKLKEKLFDWRPEKMRGERSKNEKVVIIKNLFQPSIFEKEVQLILDYQNDVREECSKCGTVRKVVIYDRHPEGVAQVNMSSPEEADLVIQMMQGRFFGQRQLSAEHWDGKTKYKIIESETEVQKRLNNWDQFLETEEHKESKTDGDDDCMPESKLELQSKSEAAADTSDVTSPLVAAINESKDDETYVETISETVPATTKNSLTIEDTTGIAKELNLTNANSDKIWKLETGNIPNSGPAESIADGKTENNGEKPDASTCMQPSEDPKEQNQDKIIIEEISELQSEITTLPAKGQP